MPEILAYSIADACEVGGFGKTRCYELIASGALDARKNGGKTVITAASLRAYVNSLPRADIRTKAAPSAA